MLWPDEDWVCGGNRTWKASREHEGLSNMYTKPFSVITSSLVATKRYVTPRPVQTAANLAEWKRNETNVQIIARILFSELHRNKNIGPRPRGFVSRSCLRRFWRPKRIDNLIDTTFMFQKSTVFVRSAYNNLNRMETTTKEPTGILIQISAAGSNSSFATNRTHLRLPASKQGLHEESASAVSGGSRIFKSTGEA